MVGLQRFSLVFVALLQLAEPRLYGSESMPKEQLRLPQQVIFNLDGVTIELSGSFLPAATFFASAPGDRNQVATAATWNPFQEMSIVAVPFGTKVGTEDLPFAEPGEAASYQSHLREYRARQGGLHRTAQLSASLVSRSPVSRV